MSSAVPSHRHNARPRGATPGHRLAGALAEVGLGVIALDRGGSVLEANRHAAQLLRAPDSQLAGEAFLRLVHDDDRGALDSEFGLLLTGAIRHIRRIVRLVGRDDGEICCELAVHALSGDGAGDSRVGAVALLEEVRDRERHDRELARLADDDALTGLLNRRRMIAELDRQQAWSRRFGCCATLLLVNLDNLAEINCSHGHSAGDRAIRTVADVLRARTRASDVAARISGDQFAVLLPAASHAQASVVADRLSDAIGIAQRRQPPDAISVSVAVRAVDGSSPIDELVADTPPDGRGRIEKIAIDASQIPTDVDLPGPIAAARAANGSDRSHRAAHGAQAPTPAVQLDVMTVLDTVGELGSASVSLLAWELCTDEDALSAAWAAALDERLLQPSHYEPADREWHYSLSAKGGARRRARGLRTPQPAARRSQTQAQGQHTRDELTAPTQPTT